MKLVVGLGNPGSEYKQTKHNVGFWVIDAFAKREGLSLSPLRAGGQAEKKGGVLVGRGAWGASDVKIGFILAKPQTFMNRSGQPVQQLLKTFDIPLADLIVIYDDLDLDLGRIRIKAQGRSGGHRGIASIIDAVGSDQFLRMKIGIGRDPWQDPSDYVLTPFRPGEKKAVLEGVEKGVEALPLLLENKITEAMNRYHPL